MSAQRKLPRVALAGLLAVACGDDDGGPPDAPPAPDARIDAPPPPPMPAVHATQLDRMGRPAINTALHEPFEADQDLKNAARDAYNAATTAAEWMSYVPGFALSLAALDALDTMTEDGDGCGDQAFFDPTSGYVTLAAVAADDRLYVDTSRTGPCFIYLGVEGAATGFLPNQDCGGRVPQVTVNETQDPIDVTYSLAATGEAGTMSDSVQTDDRQADVSNDTFPFLAPP